VAVKTSEKQEAFLTALSKLRPKAAVLAACDDFAAAFRPKATTSKYPAPLVDLKDVKYQAMSRADLEEVCAEISISVTPEQAKHIEEATRAQADSKLWHVFRAGRVTASSMKAACHTSLEKPSPSLVRALCHPDNNKLCVPATEHGKAHEEEAKLAYFNRHKLQHTTAVLSASGLVINPTHLELGPSPDALVSCECCGRGVVEIKCPYTVNRPEEHPCLETTSDGLRLNISHQYYYQVQTQIHLCEVAYCDFVVWTREAMLVLRILPDSTLWENVCCKSKTFFQKVLRLELCGNYFTKRDKLCFSPIKQNRNVDQFCLCGGGQAQSNMVPCRNVMCEGQWFHMECVKLKRMPKGKWVCPKCRIVP